MNDTNDRRHDDWLDDVALYAIGSLPMKDADRVRSHIATCDVCRREYAALQPVVGALAQSVEAPASGPQGIAAGPLLKQRVMRAIASQDGETRSAGARPPSSRQVPRERATLWPAYLVAAACVAIALISSISDITLSAQLRQSQAELALAQSRTNQLASTLADRESEISDLMGTGAKHYAVQRGEVVRNGTHLYIALHDLASPPHGHVYQAWTLPKGSKTVTPSLTFVPDTHGVAVVALPANANDTAMVAVSVEPEGGSKQPTTKPLMVVPLD